MEKVAFGVWVAKKGGWPVATGGAPAQKAFFKILGEGSLSPSFILVTKTSCIIAVSNTFICISV